MYRWTWRNKEMQQNKMSTMSCIFITKECDAVLEKQSLEEIIYNIV